LAGRPKNPLAPEIALLYRFPAAKFVTEQFFTAQFLILHFFCRQWSQSVLELPITNHPAKARVPAQMNKR
jgi:hypothetical protein